MGEGQAKEGCVTSLGTEKMGVNPSGGLERGSELVPHSHVGSPSFVEGLSLRFKRFGKSLVYSCEVSPSAVLPLGLVGVGVPWFPVEGVRKWWRLSV
jgi:hypothetical protein